MLDIVQCMGIALFARADVKADFKIASLMRNRMENHQQVGLALQALQQIMVTTSHWSDVGISVEALGSQQPFCLDTMNFSQWLQFIFIPRIQALINAGQALPTLAKGQGLEPMACEFYKNTDADRDIIVLIRQIDGLLQD
jgi:uncharacterized protein YqcC (DUF446 family)